MKNKKDKKILDFKTNDLNVTVMHQRLNFKNSCLQTRLSPNEDHAFFYVHQNSLPVSA